MFTNERGFSHEIRSAEWDIAIALAAFLALLLVAARTSLPRFTVPLAYGSVAIVDGLAALRVGGLIGLALVLLAVVLIAVAASRFSLPPLVLLASLAADYPLLRALADPLHASPLPLPSAVLAIAVPAVTLPFVVVDRERLLGRWGMWLVGTGMFGLLTERYFMRVSSVVAPDDVLLTLGGLVFCVLATQVATARWSRVVGAAAVGALVLVALLLLQGASYVSDSAVVVDEAARARLREENPYLTVDVKMAIDARGLSPDLHTAFEGSSDVERAYVYPAGSFVPSWALFALGAQDVRYGFLALLVAMYAFAIARMPLEFGAYVGAVALVDIMAMRQVALAGVEPSWALFMLVALVAVAPPVGAVGAGLAAAARQTAWLYLPWLAIDRWRRDRGEAVRWAAIGVALFAIVNAPFALPDLGRWVAAVMSPFVSPYVPLGFGLVRFSTDGPLPLGPRWAYTVATVIALAFALWTYARHREQWRYGLAVLPVAPLYVAWRSLQNYFMFTPLFLLVLLGAQERSGEGDEPAS